MTFFDEHIWCIRPRGRRSSWLSEERRVKRVSRNGGCCAGEDRVCGSSGHCTGLFGSRFQGPSLLTGPSSLLLPIPLCRLSSDPPSRGVSSPLRRSSWSRHPCSSRFRFALRLARSCANRGATSRYFVGFILENIWWLACGQRELARSGNPLAGGKRVARARG